MVKPIVFIIISSLIYTISFQIFHFNDGYIKASFGNENSVISIISNWISDNYGYTNILMGFFIAFWVKVFFRKHNYNFFEILILLFFLMGIGMLSYAFFGLVGSIINVDLIDNGGAIIVFLYMSWGIGQFFGKKIKNYLKGLLSYTLGMITFMIIALSIGFVIDYYTMKL